MRRRNDRKKNVHNADARPSCPQRGTAPRETPSKLAPIWPDTNPVPPECTGIATGTHRDCHRNAPGLPRECTGTTGMLQKRPQGSATSYKRETTASPTTLYGRVFRVSVRPEPVQGRNEVKSKDARWVDPRPLATSTPGSLDYPIPKRTELSLNLRIRRGADGVLQGGIYLDRRR